MEGGGNVYVCGVIACVCPLKGLCVGDSNVLSTDSLVGSGPFCPFLDISIFQAFYKVRTWLLIRFVWLMSSWVPRKGIRSGLINHKSDPFVIFWCTHIQYDK